MRTVRLPLLLVAAAGCRSAEPAPPATAASDDADAAALVDPRPDAGALLGRARAELERGDPRDALATLDEVVEREPGNADAWYLRGRAGLDVAATDSQPLFYYTDALADFERALAAGRDDAGALAWASRSARLAGDGERALELARRANAADEEQPAPPPVELPPERVLVEAAFDAYVAERGAEADASALFAETEDAVQALLGRTPDDPWAWTQLANLYQWEQRADDARDVLGRALAIRPEDAGLHQRYAEAWRTTGGYEAVRDAYATFHEEHPGVVLGGWYLAWASFEQALEDLNGGADASTRFGEAEARFRDLRAEAPELEGDALGYEVMCRTGAGWAHYNAGDLDAARETFLSTEELLPGGIAWEVKGRLPSALVGLEFVAGQLGEDPEDADGLAAAAAVFERLRALQPDEANLANNAGFFHRDAGVQLELAQRRAAEDAARAQDPDERARLEAEAAALRARARSEMRASRAAYEDAARLAPEDVRIVNDAALVLVYYLREDAATAEAELRRAIELGEEQLRSMPAFDEGREALQEAYGDAYQNLGVLYLVEKRDPDGALEFLRRSREIGPRPRPELENLLIPAAGRLLASEETALDDVERLVVWPR